MKITIAIDSFKGSLTSLEAGESAAKGIRKVYPDADICVRPLADGGEGTVQALAAGCDGNIRTIKVTGPLGQTIECEYGIIEETKTAIIEMSAAAGITLVTDKERNPLYTTTFGVGEIIKDAIKTGCRHFIVGIGGSATNDGGIGMLQALGFGIMDKSDTPVPLGAIGLKELDHITYDNVISRLNECTFRIACDVTNPLCGSNGCSTIFAPQKGASPEMITQMDKWLSHYADIAKESRQKADPDHAGAGAAGGLGFAFLTFFNASLESGVKIVLDETRLCDYIKDSDIIITGEGCLDGQTVMGKAPIGVAKIAKKYGKPVIAFSGCVTKDAVRCNNVGIDAFFPIIRSVTSLEKAMNTENAKNNMEETVEQVFRLLTIKNI